MMFSLPGCLFHRLTGLYCPGCGGTRAVKFLLHGHPLLSLWYHPLVIYSIFALMYYGVIGVMRIAGHRRSAFVSWPLWGALIVLAVNFVFKNAILLIGGVDPLNF